MEKEVVGQELMTIEAITKELTREGVLEAIDELDARYKKLTIKDLNDRPGYEAVHVARIDIKGRRIKVEKKSAAMKRAAIDYQHNVNTATKMIIGRLTPIEDYLNDEESRIDEEKARIKAEAEAKIAAMVKARADRLYSLDCRFDGTKWLYRGTDIATQAEIADMNDENFNSVCKTIQDVKDAEAKAEAEAEAVRKAEADRLAKVAEEQDRIAAEQAKERERLAAESKKLQDEKDRLAKEKQAAEEAVLKEEQDKLRAAEMEKAKAEAAEKARIETEARIKRETEEKEAREKAEIEEKARKEATAKIAAEKKLARRPDKEKLLAYSRAISDVPLPELKHAEFTSLLETVVTEIGQVLSDLNKRMEEM